MTQQQFQELKSLAQENAEGNSRNYEMVGHIYEEHSDQFERAKGRLTLVEERF
mgnify:CR=1 FL=1|jgi:hypothetical protein